MTWEVLWPDSKLRVPYIQCTCDHAEFTGTRFMGSLEIQFQKIICTCETTYWFVTHIQKNKKIGRSKKSLTVVSLAIAMGQKDTLPELALANTDFICYFQCILIPSTTEFNKIIMKDRLHIDV